MAVNPQESLLPRFPVPVRLADTTPGAPRALLQFATGELLLGDALNSYETWPPPDVIISDGPYGLGSFAGDPPTVDTLTQWYEPHVAAWSRRALPSTTLWFWNSELGWATVHPLLLQNGWEFRNCHIWDKGKAHVAGNANTKTLRKFPVVTEVCVQYTRVVQVPIPGQVHSLNLKDWLRFEWERTGLPLSKTNEACGVLNAATRKYFTKDHLWYFPPPGAFEKLALYANSNGRVEGRPYFTFDGEHIVTAQEWQALRAKFECLFGIDNVWREPPVNGSERMRTGLAALHLNQKPLKLVELSIRATSNEGDVVWEPFGGTATAAVAAIRLKRRSYTAEINEKYFWVASERIRTELDNQ